MLLRPPRLHTAHSEMFCCRTAHDHRSHRAHRGHCVCTPPSLCTPWSLCTPRPHTICITLHLVIWAWLCTVMSHSSGSRGQSTIRVWGSPQRCLTPGTRTDELVASGSTRYLIVCDTDRRRSYAPPRTHLPTRRVYEFNATYQTQDYRDSGRYIT